MKLNSAFVMYESLVQYNKKMYCGPSTICDHGKDIKSATAQRAELTLYWLILNTSME
jgi:hypothetical protein